MPRPAEHLLDPASYPFEAEIATRFADVPGLKHINNVVIAGLFEEGRVRFGQHVVGSPDWTMTAYLASAHIDYLDRAYYPQPVHCRVGVERIGGASLTMVQLLLQGGVPRAICRAVDVYSADGRSAPIPDALRARFAPFMLKAG